jgi:hypothetical protein
MRTATQKKLEARLRRIKNSNVPKQLSVFNINVQNLRYAQQLQREVIE